MSLTTSSSGKALVLGAAALCTSAVLATAYARKQHKYPYTRRDESVHDKYTSSTKGTVFVPTPYHWMENPEAPEVQAWVDAQNKVTNKFLDTCADVKEQTKEALTKLNNFEKIGTPFRRGSRSFHFWNSGLLNHSVLKVYDDIDGPSDVLLDPNTLSADGTSALGAYSISECGSYLAYAVSKSGSDWSQISVRDVSTKQDLTDKLDWVKFSSIAWTKDASGFFYSRYPPPKSLANKDGADKGTEVDAASGHMLYFHKLNTPQSDDVLICAPTCKDEHEWLFGAEVTDCGRWLVISVANGCDPVNQVWLLDLQSQNPLNTSKFDIVKLVDNFAAGYDYISNEGSVFYFKTNLEAPRYKLISVNIETGARATLIEEHAVDVLNFVVMIGGDKPVLMCCHLKDVKHVLTLRALSNLSSVSEIELPEPGTIGGLGARRQDSDFYFSFTSFTSPSVIFRHQLGAVKPIVWKTVTAGDLDAKQFSVRQVFFTSKDGTRVPMFVITRAGAKLDGNAPTLLYGYGGFNIPLMPGFAASRLLWVQRFNGVYAMANLRGGGEYGEEWHKAGSLLQKQNVFDDFQAAAEYLIAEKYTCSQKLSIMGGSNGGLLVAACINQRPELYGAAVGQVGVMDMLKFHRYTIGYAWKSDYGDPDSPEYFDYLYGYSPLHNVNANKTYPATLLCTADHDDRVVPNHSYKLIAQLQHSLGEQPHQKAPLLIKIETKAGHGAGKPLSKQIDETASIFSFLAKTLGAQWQ